MMTVEKLLTESNLRSGKLHGKYNPITGENSLGRRIRVEIKDMYPYRMFLPETMFKNKLIKQLIKYKSIEAFCTKVLKEEYNPQNREAVIRQFIRIRNRHDFQYWAYVFTVIKNKEGGKNIHFYLNYPQRILLETLEEMRIAQIPIRIIILKARQWGGSTLVQLYIAWIQLVHREGWYSVIVAQDGSTSRKIKAMYSKFLEQYPGWLLGLPEGQQLAFSPYEGSQLDSIITVGRGAGAAMARDTVITVGSYNSPSAGRGGDMSCVHYSEVGLWEDTEGKKPEDIIRSISSSLLIAPLTIEAIESTANGMGNFFYRACQDAKEGRSNRRFVFISWLQIDRYELPFESEKEKEKFAAWLIDNKDNENPPAGYLDAGKYHWRLWMLGATLEGIHWYTVKRKDYTSHADMAAEFPSDDIEAFKNSGNSVFNIYYIDNLRETCIPPDFVGEIQAEAVKGEKALKNVHFREDHAGSFKIWEKPEKEPNVSNRYLVVVDVGGRSNTADYSDIYVLDRYWMMYGGNPETAAEWHGHIDHDLLAWKAVGIAAYYNNALLVIESNTIETKDNDPDGDQSEYIFNQISGVYDNLYARQAPKEKIRQGIQNVWGFQTNRKTKPAIISNLVAILRDGGYVEKNIEVLEEYAFYEKKPNGSFGAMEGKNDDMLMTRAIALYICYLEMDLPKRLETGQRKRNTNRPISEATI
jgi:hypothetical protein